MSILATDLVAYGCANRPTDDTSASGGAIDATRRVVFTQLGVTARALRALSDGADTRQLTVTGRLSTGEMSTESITLNGATPVIGAKIWERILRVDASGTDVARTITVTDAASNALGTIPPNEIGFYALFINSSSDQVNPQVRYEKIFWKNRHSTLALLNAEVRLTIDASGNTAVGLAAAAGDSLQVSNRTQAPAGVSFVGVNVAVPMPGTNLSPGAAIGVWVRQSLDAQEAAQNSNFTTQLKGSSV